MLSKYIPYTKIYLLAFLLLAIGLSTGKFLMSLASITLASAWVLEGKYKEKWERIKAFYYAPLILAFGYVIHVVWLFNTTNYQYAFHDLVLKLPLLSFPIVMGSIPKLSNSQYKLIIGVFIVGLLVSTLISYGVYLEVFPTKRDISDVRNISIFISHIRLSLLICLAVALSFYYFFSAFKLSKIITVLLSIWFCYFLYILSGTGIIVMCLLIVYALFWIIIKQRSKTVKAIVGLISLTFIIIATSYVYFSFLDYSKINDTADLNNLERLTKNGEPYIHDVNNLVTENGYYIWIYISPYEVKNAWEKRSSVPFDSLSGKGQPIAAAIYRYMTSKGLRKDKEGVEQLIESDIVAIEAGATSTVKLFGIKKRLHQIFFEFEHKQSGNSANDHSVTQRLSFYNTGLLIFKDHLWFGVGTGDVADSFGKKYIEMSSALDEGNRKRAHNQFLTFLIAFGFIGSLLWGISFVYPLLKIRKDHFVYGAFLLILLISFLGEDTLETQAGVTFFAFFNSLFLFHSKQK